MFGVIQAIPPAVWLVISCLFTWGGCGFLTAAFYFTQWIHFDCENESKSVDFGLWQVCVNTHNASEVSEDCASVFWGQTDSRQTIPVVLMSLQVCVVASLLFSFMNGFICLLLTCCPADHQMMYIGLALQSICSGLVPLFPILVERGIRGKKPELWRLLRGVLPGVSESMDFTTCQPVTDLAKVTSQSYAIAGACVLLFCGVWFIVVSFLIVPAAQLQLIKIQQSTENKPQPDFTWSPGEKHDSDGPRKRKKIKVLPLF